MKQPIDHFRILFCLLGCALLAGCQSSSLSPTRLSGNMFGSKKEALAKSGPDTSHSEYALGEEALQQGKFKAARSHFQKVVQVNPDHAGAHHRLAFLADREKEYNRAEIHYLAAMRIEPKNADIVCDLGYSYLLQERFDDSRKTLEKALKVNPQHRSTLLNMGTLLGKQGDYAGALAFFRQAGNESEAQENIARLFPQGPPAGMDNMLAQSGAVSSQTRDLQEKLAKAQQAPSSQTPHAAHALQARELPMHMINDAFAQIDAETNSYSQQGMNGAEIAQANHAPYPGMSPGYPMSQADHHQPVYAGGSSPPPFPMSEPAQQSMAQPMAASSPVESFSSLPGELPLTPTAPPVHESYAGFDQNQPGGMPENSVSPYYQAANNQPTENLVNNMPGSQPFPAPGTAVSAAPVTPVAVSTAGHPFAAIGNQNSTSQAAPGSDQYREAMQRALQIGMNAGPGQMFPISNEQNLPTARPAFHSAIDGIVPRQYPPATQALPPIASSTNHVNLAPIQQVGNQQAGGQPLPVQTLPVQAPLENGTVNHVPDWAFAPTQERAHKEVQTPLQAQTPWGTPIPQTNGTSQSPAATMPMTHPQAQHHVPQQWPHSPQAGGNGTGSGPVIHRGTASMPGSAADSNRLPEVYPAVRQ